MLLRAVMIVVIILPLAGCDLFKRDEKLSFEDCINKATYHRNKGEVEKAISYYKKALKARPNDANTHFILGEYYDQEYSRSLEDSQGRAQMDFLMNPTRPRKRENLEKELIELYGLKKEYERLAIEEFKETVNYDPNNWMARYYIATDYLNNKQYNEAIGEYKKVVELNPSWANPYGLIGEAYRKMHSYESSIKYLRKAIELDPNFERNYYRLGLVYRQMNNGEKAKEMAAKLKDMNSQYYFDFIRYKGDDD